MTFLTARELEVLMLSSNGYRRPDIARLLWVSPHTVRAHQRKIMRKLEARNVTAAVAVALRDGMIE